MDAWKGRCGVADDSDMVDIGVLESSTENAFCQVAIVPRDATGEVAF